MKKNSLRFAWTFLLSIVFAGLTAQNVPVNLNSGWNWISYPRSEAMSLEAAMEGFTPASGDMIKSMSASSTYQNGQWQGSLTELVPGEGYMYYSASGQSMSFVFGSDSGVTGGVPEEALDGEFTVDASGTKVRFSPGNLQFRIDSNKENTAQLGIGSVTHSALPYSTYYKYSLSQMVFRAGELSSGGLAPGTISGFAFESYSPYHYFRSNIEIWISTTTLTSAPSTSLSTSSMTKVFTGAITQQDGWTTVSFSTPFTWDGTSNLLVTVVMNHGAYYNKTEWQCNELSYTASCYANRDGSETYQPSSSTYSMTTTTYRPNIRFIGKGAGVWRFATNQTDYVGAANSNLSSSNNGWIDLFGWGTSGHGHRTTCFQPWSSSTDETQYYAYGISTYNLNGQTGEADWGCNSISNGGDQPFLWRTLTKDEWVYLFNTRSTSSGKRYAKATVGGVKGMVLLPDNWSTSYYYLSNTNTSSANFSSNTISATEWLTLEQHGAVFLPTAGSRSGTSVTDTGSNGYYWTASNNSNGEGASRISFRDGSAFITDGWARKYVGCSVRLVCQTNPKVRTIGVSNVTSHSATVTGEVQYSGSSTVSYRGVECFTGLTSSTMWSSGSGTGSFTVEITGLVPNTTYRVRAYSYLGSTYRFGNYITFTTSSVDEGVAGGVFSVSATKKVEFSKGNLQYQASTDTWRFAPSQWTVIGSNNTNISSTYSGWIDLFGWGTSGHNHGAVCYQPWSTSTTINQYYAYGSSTANLIDQTGQADWGCNPISNADNKPNQWRTLTCQEWGYLTETRTTSSGIRYAKAIVNSVNGLILLPDDWSASTYSLSNTNTYDASFSSNTITALQWNVLEKHGAVFLPTTGYRNGTEVHNVTALGQYWSSTIDSSSSYLGQMGSMLSFRDAFFTPRGRNYYYSGISVRLVRDVR